MAKNNILILGKGFIGERLQKIFDCPVSSKRITCFKDAEGELQRYGPKILMNCIGSTGKNHVDDCEADKDKTLSSNVFVPMILAEAALRQGVKLIHISSGCIYHFDHSKDEPLSEDRT